MEEQARVVPANELLQHILGLASGALDVHGSEDGDYVVEEKLSVADATGRGFRIFCGLGVEEAEDAQFSAYKGSGARLQVWRGGEHVRGIVGIARDAVGPDVHGEEVVAVDMAAADQSEIGGWRRATAHRAPIPMAARDE